MPLPAPPMYHKVPRKVPPNGRKIAPVAPPATRPPPAIEAPSEEVEEMDEGREEDGEGGEDDGEGAEDGEEEEESDGASSLTARQRRKLGKWSEDMSQRNLYTLAKSAGLDVRVRDSKDDLIKAIKDALG